MKQAAVFLDRDGVLNVAAVRAGKPYPPDQASNVVIFSDVSDGLAALRRAGFALIVVTNQPDVARGRTSRDAVDGINRRVSEALCLDTILTCFHDDVDQCECRKPKAGLLFKMQRERQIDLGSSFMVGDRWRDIEAGRNAGCRTVFIDRGYSEPKPIGLADFCCDSFGAAARWILTSSNKEDIK